MPQAANSTTLFNSKPPGPVALYSHFCRILEQRRGPVFPDNLIQLIEGFFPADRPFQALCALLLELRENDPPKYSNILGLLRDSNSRLTEYWESLLEGKDSVCPEVFLSAHQLTDTAGNPIPSTPEDPHYRHPSSVLLGIQCYLNVVSASTTESEREAYLLFGEELGDFCCIDMLLHNDHETLKKNAGPETQAEVLKRIQDRLTRVSQLHPALGHILQSYAEYVQGHALEAYQLALFARAILPHCSALVANIKGAYIFSLGFREVPPAEETDLRPYFYQANTRMSCVDTLLLRYQKEIQAQHERFGISTPIDFCSLAAERIRPLVDALNKALNSSHHSRTRALA